MADFSSVKPISSNIRAAEEILSLLQGVYNLCGVIERILSRYNTDPAFKTEADHLFTVDQLAELGDMITDLIALRQDWETNHPGVVQLTTIVMP